MREVQFLCMRLQNRSDIPIAAVVEIKKESIPFDDTLSVFLLTVRSLTDLAYATGHLQLDQAVEFNCVFHWELFGDWLDEAVDDQ